MTEEKKRLGKTVSDGFPEILPYWDVDKNSKLGIMPETTTASARINVHLKCPHCGREYEQKLNNAYTINKNDKCSSFDGYCAACRPRTIHAITQESTPKHRTYELLGFYPDLIQYFDVDANKYARMPYDKRFIVIHKNRAYKWIYKGKTIFTTVDCMLNKISADVKNENIC